MNIRPKTTNELLGQLIQMDSSVIDYGLQDEMTHEQELAEGVPIEEQTSLHTQFGTELGRIMQTLETDEEADIQALMDESYANNQHLHGEPSQSTGYVGALRLTRRIMENSFRSIAAEMDNAPVRHPEFIDAKNSDLLLSNNPNKVKEMFPGGNFLYHGTFSPHIGRILDSGILASSTELTRRKLIEVQNDENHGGSVGISWSINTVEALPGDTHHMAGFLMSPEKLLSKYGGKLFVPVTATPYEVQYIASENGALDLYKKAEVQTLAWEDVYSSAHAYMATQQGAEVLPEFNSLPRTLRLLSTGEVTADDLRERYSFVDGVTTFDSTIVSDPRINTLSVYLQSVIDGGDAKEIIGRDVKGLTELTAQELFNLIDISLVDYAQDEMEEVAEVTARAHDSVAQGAVIKVEDTIFVCSDRDLPYWQKVLARSKHAPAGILTYDARTIRTTNFVLERGLGDHEAFTNAIREVIAPTDETIGWEDLLPGQKMIMKPGINRFLVNSDQTYRAKEIVLDKSDNTLIIK